MACNCGKPKGTCGCNKDCHASPAVLQINNPAECSIFHRVEVPVQFGDDTEYPPENGKYKNTLLYYQKNGAVYLYSSDGIPTRLTHDDPEAEGKPYVSLRRLGSYTYEITFDKLPEYRPTAISASGCSSFVKDGKLYRNFDWHYDEAPTFVVKCKGFTGIANGDKLVDGKLDNDDALAQLPYRIVDGYNDNGIMMSTHVLYNDWNWNGCGDKSISMQKLPYLVLNKVKSMATIASDLENTISNLSGLAGEYLLQLVITDGVTTYALLPPENAEGSYELVDITANPKLTNFRWVENETVERNADYMQTRPTGVERWNEMSEDMSELRFTKAYETNARLSEFIGINGTTKASPDSNLQTIYTAAHGKYLNRTRNGELWQTVHSVVYSKHGMEHLYTQENWDIDYIADVDSENDKKACSKVDYFHISPESTIDDIADAFESRREKVIEFAKSEYIINRNLYLTSDTTILLNGATLKTTNGSKIFSYRPEDTFIDYDGVKSVKIKNGNIGLCFAIMHASDIVFNDLTFLPGVATHAIQMAGVKNIVIDGCDFNGMSLHEDSRGYQEMVQLEPCTHGGQPWAPEDSPMFNNLGNYNILIENCNFFQGDKVTSKLYTAIGTHASNSVNPFFNKRVIIRNCSVYDADYSSISTFGADEWTIENNAFIKNDMTDDSIHIRIRGKAKNFFIRNNIIHGGRNAVGNVNVDKCENIVIEGNDIENTLDGASTSIFVRYVDRVLIRGNTIKSYNKSIDVNTLVAGPINDIIIDGNVFEHTSSSHSYTIDVGDDTHGTIITNNTVKQLANVAFLDYHPSQREDESQLYYANNIIDAVGRSSVNDIVSHANMNASNVYGSYFTQYSAGSAYAEITDKTPNVYPFSDFNRALVKVSAASNGSVLRSEVIMEYDMQNKLSTTNSNRIYDFFMNNPAGNAIISGRLTIKNDGTFSWSSPNGAMTLLGIYGFNDYIQ